MIFLLSNYRLYVSQSDFGHKSDPNPTLLGILNWFFGLESGLDYNPQSSKFLITFLFYFTICSRSLLYSELAEKDKATHRKDTQPVKII